MTAEAQPIWQAFRLDQLFELRKGKRLTKANMKPGRVPFIGAVDSANGVSAYVDKAMHTGGVISVAYNGSVGEAFYQPDPFWATDDVNVLYPQFEMTPEAALFICTVIRGEKYRFNYGRKWNLERMNASEIQLPVNEAGNLDVEYMTSFIKALPFGVVEDIAHVPKPASTDPAPDLGDSATWKAYEYQELFDIERGRGPRRKDLDGTGSTPFVTSTDSSNGVSGVTSMAPTHPGNVIGVNRNGSVGEAFYQPVPFCSTEDVHIFRPKFDMTPAVGLFLATLIQGEKYRFNYGRKWGIERMKKSVIRLPVAADGQPDWARIEAFIKTLPYSSHID